MEMVEVLQKLNGTLERIEGRLEHDDEARRAWTEIADEMKKFREELSSAQRRTGEALVVARSNADRSVEAGRAFVAEREAERRRGENSLSK